MPRNGTPASGGVAVVDLTSSPEFEPNSLLQQTPNRPELLRIGTVENSSFGQRGEGSQPAARVNPDHLSRIIDTTPKGPLIKVLSELCSLSPAFSAALVRGLAPHSRYAQCLLDKYGQVNSNQTPESPRANQPRGGLLPSQARVKKEFSRVKVEPQGSPIIPKTSSRSNCTAPRPILSANRGSQSSPAISNSGTSSIPTLSRSRTPGNKLYQGASLQASAPAPPSLNTSTPSRTSLSLHPVQDWLKHQDSASTPASLSRSNCTSGSAADSYLPLSKCQNCQSAFQQPSEEDACFYHPGRKQMIRDRNNPTGPRVMRYTCCDGGQYDAPCELGPHIAEDISNLDTNKRPLSTVGLSGRSNKSGRLS